ncbi:MULTISPECIES: response regulator transcription factor [Streptomyces]|uniref:response regulator transcription factor n=1 Tax=Streptomyces TaxID=1883 RepID=UPI00163BD38E|nr:MULTISPECIES: response regulator transcription factor [Streptomyces]MBC2879502.1 response regulator transcription factor [Streptomyces sp. TYQ1024]UBI35020.1 response regulator transcription factor [Streptomyces mobaraensis]UKW27620.1 response regulator transcription factor [Streptomyces sp. TYQ1024]
MRVVIADDDTLIREGLAALLTAEGCDVAAAVAHPDDLAAAVAAHRPDVAVVDVRMPPTHTDEGIRAAVRVRRFAHPPAVLILSAHAEQSFATELLAAGAAGIGYLLKERVGRVREFVDALRRVADGGTAIDPEVVSRLLARRQAVDAVAGLTAREREVLALMAQGLGNTALARRLGVSDNAVQKHIRKIFAKLGLPPDEEVDRRVVAVLRHLEALGR